MLGGVPRLSPFLIDLPSLINDLRGHIPVFQTASAPRPLHKHFDSYCRGRNLVIHVADFFSGVQRVTTAAVTGFGVGFLYSVECA